MKKVIIGCGVFLLLGAVFFINILYEEGYIYANNNLESNVCCQSDNEEEIYVASVFQGEIPFKLFYLTNDGTHSLYYEPLYGNYYQSELIKTNIVLEELNLSNTDYVIEYYKHTITNVLTVSFTNPVSGSTNTNNIEAINDFHYVGMISDLEWIYTNTNGIYIQKHESFIPKWEYDSSYGEVEYNFMDRKIHPIPISNNYIYVIDSYEPRYISRDINGWVLRDVKDPEITNQLGNVYYYYIPSEVLEEGTVVTSVVRKMQEMVDPYSYIERTYIPIMTNVPMFLVSMLADHQYGGKDSELHTNAIAQVMPHFQENLMSNFHWIYPYVSSYAMPTFLSNLPVEFVQKELQSDIVEYFMRTEIISDDICGFEAFFSHIPKEALTESVIRDLYTASLRYYDSWDCYAFEMPKFQALLKLGIPMPLDLMIPRYDSKLEKEIIQPVIHSLVHGGYENAIKLLLEKVPDYDISITNHKGQSIVQTAIQSGNPESLNFLLDNIPNLNPLEVNSKNQTWVDLAYELPLYHYIDVCHSIDRDHLGIRKIIIEDIAPKYNIKANFPLNVFPDTYEPNSLIAVQKRIMETNAKYKPIYPYEIEERHRYIFTNNIATDFDLTEFVRLREYAFYRYSDETLDIYDRIVKLLVDEAKVNVHQKDINRRNLLYYVVQTPRTNLFSYLIDKGLDPHGIDIEGNNIWFRVLYTDQYAVITYPAYPDLYTQNLMDLKVNINITNINGETPYQNYVKYYHDKSISEQLILYGADTNGIENTMP